MAAYNKFQQFVEDLCKKKVDVSADNLFLMLTNTSPNVADTVVDTTTGTCTIKSTSNAAEIAAGNGYTKKGGAVTVTTAAQSAGTFTLAANQVVFTAAGGTIGAFRYTALFDDSGGAAATRPVIAWWDYGSSITLNDGETFTVKFNSANPGTIFTLA
jgi:hypothetical protein